MTATTIPLTIWKASRDEIDNKLRDEDEDQDADADEEDDQDLLRLYTPINSHTFWTIYIDQHFLMRVLT